MFKEFGKTLDHEAQEEVKEVLARGRRLLDSDDTTVLQEAIDAVQGAAKHLTQVMLMDPTQLLGMIGGGDRGKES